MERYEPREIEGRWAVYDTVEDRVTGWFGRGESEAAGAESHAREMNEVAAAPLEEDYGDEPVSRHAARARPRSCRSGRRTDLAPIRKPAPAPG